MNFIEFDITFCCEECGNLACYRNPIRMPDDEMKYPHPYAMFRDTEFCEGYKEKGGAE